MNKLNFQTIADPIVTRSYCLVETNLVWPTDAQIEEVVTEPGLNSADRLARLDWRIFGFCTSPCKRCVTLCFRHLKIQRDEAHLLRFISSMHGHLFNMVEMDLRGGIVEMDYNSGRSWRRSFFDGKCVTYTLVKQVCVLSFKR